MEQLDYNLMFRWFVGLGIDDPVWVPTVFTKNRDRLLDADVAAKFMEQLLAHKEVRRLLSDEHFSVDGTLIAAWASMKSFQPKPEPTAPDKTPDDTGGDPTAPARDTDSRGQADTARTRDKEPGPADEGPKRRGRLPRPEALQRDACLDHRSRRTPLSQGRARRPGFATWVTH